VVTAMIDDQWRNLCMRQTYRKSSALLLAPFLLAACATTGGPGGTAGNGERACNPVITGGIGAALGALIGGSGDRVAGAAVGAAVGALACVAFNHHSEQVKTGKQVDDDYRRVHGGKLPEQPAVVRYTSTFDPASIKAGSEAKLTSYIEVTGSRTGAAPVVEEEIALYKPDGALVRKAKKAVAEQATAGAFKNTFTIPMPAGVPQGDYKVTTSLYVNGAVVDSNNSQLQVVMAQPVFDAAIRIASR